MAVRCLECGAVVRTEHRCRMRVVPGHCKHYRDLTPDNCGECAIERDRQTLAQADTRIAELGRAIQDARQDVYERCAKFLEAWSVNPTHGATVQALADRVRKLALDERCRRQLNEVHP